MVDAALQRAGRVYVTIRRQRDNDLYARRNQARVLPQPIPARVRPEAGFARDKGPDALPVATRLPQPHARHDRAPEDTAHAACADTEPALSAGEAPRILDACKSIGHSLLRLSSDCIPEGCDPRFADLRRRGRSLHTLPTGRSNPGTSVFCLLCGQ